MNQNFQFMIFTLANDHYYYLTFKCDLDLHIPEQMFQMALLLPKENNCDKLF